MSPYPQEALNERQDRLITTLEQLLENPTHTTHTLLEQAIRRVLDVLEADKMDIFFLDATNETLVARRTSDTPMARRQRAIGMDRLALANGGRVVEVFLSGVSYFNNAVDQDPNELRGIKEGLGVKSEIASVFKVQTQHRGVIMVASATPDFFTQQDLYFLEAFARWVGLVVARTELVERMQQDSITQGSGRAEEELLTLMTHDLRNYLTPLRGRLEMIEARAQLEGRERDRRDAASSLYTLQLLTRSISDVLDVASLNQGLFAVDPESMNLCEVLQEVVTPFRAEQVSISIQAPTDVILVADPERMRQALGYMLAYGVNRASSHIEITVSISIERRKDGSWVKLSVQHQGDALSQQTKSLLVSGSFVSHFTGIGLGLYLTHQIALAHHGTLTMDALSDHEIRLTFALPVEEEEIVVRGEDEVYVPL